MLHITGFTDLTFRCPKHKGYKGYYLSMPGKCLDCDQIYKIRHTYDAFRDASLEFTFENLRVLPK